MTIDVKPKFGHSNADVKPNVGGSAKNETGIITLKIANMVSLIRRSV